jgi:hypothetical protein
MEKPERKIERPANVTGDNSGQWDQAEILDPNDSNLLRDRIRGRTDEHAKPPRLEDEGQSGG